MVNPPKTHRQTDHGASTLNSTDYSEFLYQRELVGVVERHDPSTPLMLFYASHVAHCPLQVPKFYYDQFSFMSDDEGHCAQQTVKGVHTIDPQGSCFCEPPQVCS